MLKSRLLFVSTCFGALFSLAQCSTSQVDTGSDGAVGAGGTPTGGATGSGGNATGGNKGSGGTPTGGTTGSGGTPTGGTTGSGGKVGSGGGRVDCDGNPSPLAKPGDQTSTSKAYLNLGEMRLINNRWGSDELQCGANSVQKVYVNSDRSIGWDFNRQDCDKADTKAKPDYPEVEFGVAPFGDNSPLRTTPKCSSTTLLPKKISELTSAKVIVDTMSITLSNPTIWNIDFEVWISKQNPLTTTNPEVYAEIIAFWGWENGRWPCDKSGSLSAGTYGYHLCHQSDTWANNQWRFYNFNVDNGPFTTFNGTVDVLAFINWVVDHYGMSKDYWVTRIEVGSEIDDMTAGRVKIKNLTFEINGATRAIELGN